jgi:hypothetical protein
VRSKWKGNEGDSVCDTHRREAVSSACDSYQPMPCAQSAVPSPQSSLPLSVLFDPHHRFALEAQKELMTLDWPAEILASSEGCEMWAVPNFSKPLESGALPG